MDIKNRKIKINVASFGGRSHLLDIARELANQGYDVKFYSYTPTFYAKRFGLKKENNSFFWILTIPFIIISKITGLTAYLLYQYRTIYDYILAIFMRQCNVFIGQAPMHIKSCQKAKQKGALIIIESGLSHINEYNAYLKRNGISSKDIIGSDRFKKCYQEADYITVASEFVKKGFIKNGISEQKLFVNPYGVNITNFHPTELTTNSYDAIVVGQWCKRKGVDLIIQASKDLGIKVLHVGNIVDMPFPEDKNFTHINSVPENKLIDYYKQAKIFLFPSYEDGFGLVLIQALICGLPIVCSKNTGGPTLRQMIEDKKWIIEMDNIDVESLKQSITKALSLAKTQHGTRNYVTQHDLKQISWEAYGERYSKFIKEKR